VTLLFVQRIHEYQEAVDSLLSHRSRRAAHMPQQHELNQQELLDFIQRHGGSVNVTHTHSVPLPTGMTVQDCPVKVHEPSNDLLVVHPGSTIADSYFLDAGYIENAAEVRGNFI